jgi:hypothetical protein
MHVSSPPCGRWAPSSWWWLPNPSENLEREVLHIGLNLGIVELATNKTFGVENIKRELERVIRTCYGGSWQLDSLRHRRSDVRCQKKRSCAISLVVCNDFDTIILPHTHATKRNVSKMKEIEIERDAYE